MKEAENVKRQGRVRRQWKKEMRTQRERGADSVVSEHMQHVLESKTVQLSLLFLSHCNHFLCPAKYVIPTHGRWKRKRKRKKERSTVERSVRWRTGGAVLILGYSRSKRGENRWVATGRQVCHCLAGISVTIRSTSPQTAPSILHFSVYASWELALAWCYCQWWAWLWCSPEPLPQLAQNRAKRTHIHTYTHAHKQMGRGGECVWVRGYRKGCWLWLEDLASCTLLTSLPRRAGSNSDSLDHIPPDGKLGATTMAAQYDTMQFGKRNNHQFKKEKESNENN